MGFIKSLLLMIAIPIAGFIVSIWVLHDLNQMLADNGLPYTVEQLCTADILSQAPNLQPLCDDVTPIFWMQTAAIAAAGLAALLLLSFVIVATVAGTDRIKIAKVFPPLVFFSLLILAALVIVEGGILTYAAYVAESHWLQRIHVYLIGAIGLGALLASFGLIQSSFQLARKQSNGVLAVKLTPDEHPRLFSAIQEVAATLGARMPDHVVAGLEPNFYVTSADVTLLGTQTVLNGETLYLSLPLARILTKEEMKGVIAHELGHFRGADTFYSLKFSPVYSGLARALSAMNYNIAEEGVATLAKIPAYVVLSYMIEVFHKNVSTVSREREFEADKAAAEVVAPEALARSLLKIGLYAHAWNDLENKIVKRMRGGRIARNLSQLFCSIVKYDINPSTIPEAITLIAQQTLAHPTDSHPTTANRIAALGLNIDTIEHQRLLIPQQPCVELFGQPAVIEENLTRLQQQYYMALGIRVPKQKEYPSASLLAAFGASMVVADGKIETDEIDQAESIGLSLSLNFDCFEFREFCLHPASIPAFKDLLKAASTTIAIEGQMLILDYLQKIARADGHLSVSEHKLIDDVKSAFQLQ